MRSLPINRVVYADDEKEKVGLLLRLRLPWLIVGLVGGSAAAFLVSRFEKTLSQNISLAFFLPLIVYLSDAVGTQTQTIFVRNLSKGKANFFTYLVKELLIGIFLGLIFGLLIGILAKIWIGATDIAITVGVALFITVATAPVVALVVAEILYKEHEDPAIGAGPFTTIIQDIISILVYFIVASLILFN